MPGVAIRREVDVQRWPAVANAAKAIARALRSRSQSSSAIAAFLPPSSSAISRSGCAALSRTMRRPTAAEPVNRTPSTPSCVDRRRPLLARALHQVEHARGQARFVRSSARSRCAALGVFSLGLCTTRVAEQQRRHDLAVRQVTGEVERADHGEHAERAVADLAGQVLDASRRGEARAFAET